MQSRSREEFKRLREHMESDIPSFLHKKIRSGDQKGLNAYEVAEKYNSPLPIAKEVLNKLANTKILRKISEKRTKIYYLNLSDATSTNHDRQSKAN